MKLYTTFPGHFIGYCPMITAQHCGFAYENVYVPPGCELAANPEFIAKKAHHNFPVLELADGSVASQSVAVAKYIARESGRGDFLGNCAFE